MITINNLSITSTVERSHSTSWYSRTDGKPICCDCGFFNIYREKCIMGVNGGTSKYPASCDQYMRSKTK